MLDFNQLPTAIDINLYKYNYLDNQIWTRIKNEVDYIEPTDDSVVVSREQVMMLLDVYYSKTINKIKSIGSEFLHKEVTTPWFLYHACTEMIDLKFIKFTLNTDKQYTRMLEIEGERMVKFDFKILSMTINLFDFFRSSELVKINKVLIDLDIFEEGIPYARIKLDNFLDRLDGYVTKSLDSGDTDNKEVDLIVSFIDLIEPKIDRDNPLVLFVTDY